MATDLGAPHETLRFEDLLQTGRTQESTNININQGSQSLGKGYTEFEGWVGVVPRAEVPGSLYLGSRDVT